VRPRVAFVGLGWIGRHRMTAVVEHDIVDVVAVADADAGARQAGAALVPAAAAVSSFEEAMALQPDGVVLATPSAMHAAQSSAALAAGAAVFCQKPLGRSAREVRSVVAAARRANRLLGVDFSYRYTHGLSRIRDLVREGAIGDVYAIDLTFHNAYGPDKPWFYDVRESGGGCLLDLGVHLVDFLHWTFDDTPIGIRGHVFANGQKLTPDAARAEDYATGEIEFADGAMARLACSWKLSVGCDAQIGIHLYGTRGGLGFRNVNGSFYDFVAECYRGTQKDVLCSPPDAWGGRATIAWAQQLARSSHFDPAIAIAERVATTIDRLYGRRSDRSDLGFEVDAEDAAELRT
jgi:predicted dehydrogenase